MRKLLLHVNKNGYMFVLDRVTGRFLHSYPISENHNFAAGITEDGKWINRYEPVTNEVRFICPS